MIKVIQRKNQEEITVTEKIKKDAWIKAVHPSEQELELLTQKLHLDEDLLHDALDIYELPRIEQDEDIVYLYARFAYSEGTQILTAPILIALGKDFIITLSRKHFSGFDKFLNGKIDISTKKRTHLFLQILLHIINSYSHYLFRIGKQVYSSEVKLTKIQNKDIVQFVTYERVLNDFSYALARLHAILEDVYSQDVLKTNEDDANLLEDVMLKNGQLLEMTRGNMKSIVNIREAYSSIMTNNLNSVIKLFTSLTIILTIPTIISSIYGMNVALPFASSPFAFAGIMVSILGISIIAVVLFFIMDWL